MNQFWVDPESLSRSGHGYAEVQSRLDSLRTRIIGLSGRYALSSFGDDEEGREAWQGFTDGNDQFAGSVQQYSGAMRYISDGLRQNGADYGNSADQADAMSREFLGSGGDGAGSSRGPTARKPDVPLEPGIQEQAPMAPDTGSRKP
ncbi:hypothetical protein ACL03H_00830 [Saccharopolyspora sp. MS10]|uniref:hypothetical protein n=1 Tax=Saccharopolyspora sp. MS10 TaxID=3385973 RepID=UPI00399F390E